MMPLLMNGIQKVRQIFILRDGSGSDLFLLNYLKMECVCISRIWESVSKVHRHETVRKKALIYLQEEIMEIQN